MENLLPEKTKTAREIESVLTDAYYKYRGIILGYILARTQDGPASEDITAIVFTDFWKTLCKIGPIEESKYLLFRIARWRLLSFYTYKNKMGTAHLEEGLTVGTDDEIDLTHRFYDSADLRLIRGKIHLISPSLRGLIDMRLNEGITQDEIQELTGMSRLAVSTKIARGMNQLRRIYNEGDQVIVPRYRNGKLKVSFAERKVV